MNATSKGAKKKIAKLTQSPKAFAPLAEKINELIDALGGTGGGVGFIANGPLKLTVGASGAPVLEIDINKLGDALRTSPKAPLGAGGGGGRPGVPIGYREKAVVLCEAGASVTYTFLVR